MIAMTKESREENRDLAYLVDLYETGYECIVEVLIDGDLTAEEQLDSIADIVFDDPVEDE